MTENVVAELIEVAHAWDRAMITNDPAAIGRFMAEDWIIVGSDGRVTDKPSFLGLVGRGLTHDIMESRDFVVRVYGSTAVVISRGVSGGLYHGHRFREVERSSNVFVLQHGAWRCVLTHLSRLEEPTTAA